MNPLYNLAIHCYAGAARVAALRSSKAADMLAGQRQTLARLAEGLQARGADGYDVWFHAASLGEFEQARPLIERLRREKPDLSILLTFFSPSGYRVRCNYDKVDAVAYLPFDTPARVKAFLDVARPRMAIFVKYEFWGNFLGRLHKRGIPTFLISGIFRESQRFFKPGGGWARGVLSCFDRLYVQDDNSLRLLSGINLADKTVVAGDTRFDRVTDIRRAAKTVPVIERFVADSPLTLVAGSSWEPDESLYIPWLLRNKDVKAIIAPHEFDTRRLESLLAKFDGRARLLSQITTPDNLRGDEQVIIIDCFGLLSSLYRYGDLAWIGGGFGTGIHNINEAAVYGIPVIFGPRNRKFKEARDLIAAGGAFEVTDQTSAVHTLDMLKHDVHERLHSGKAAGDYIERSIGASDIIYMDLFS